jgi:hypothetical protein
MESLLYGVIGDIKPKKNVSFEPASMEAGMKFVRVFAKVMFSNSDMNTQEIQDASNRLKLTIASVMQNEGENPNEVLEFMENNQLTPEQLTQYNKPEKDLKAISELQSSTYVIRLVHTHVAPLFNLSLNEIMAFSNAYNNHQTEISIAGVRIKFAELSEINIFRITDEKGLENELQLSGRMAPFAKKALRIGNWSYAKFLQFGTDVTSKYLRPKAINVLPEPEIKTQKLNIPELINTGEGRTIEFKGWFRWSKGKGVIEPHIELKNLIAIAGFLNSEGGILIIGVGDNKEILGIEDDLNTFQGNQKDEFKTHFDDLISSSFGKHINRLIHLEFFEYANKTLAVVRITKSSNEVFLKKEGKEEFYIRRSGSTVQLNGSEMTQYVKAHW